uniref:Cytochrome b ascorbate-dependent protein 3 n=1 Tax=Lygus hesperus TaxID=30085 RepID=A0A146LLF6_LYGHE
MNEPPVLISFIVAQVFGLLAVICIIVASVMDNDSTAGVDAAVARFVWHPVVMTLGLVYLFGCSAVVYRVLKSLDKLPAKIIHAFIHFVALVLGAVGLYFAITAKNALNLDHFNTVHGLFGLTTLILFALQWLISLPVFLWPKAPDSIRAPGLVVHVCVGVAVFLLASATAFTGLNFKSGTTKSSDPFYKASAFFYFCYDIVILFMVTLKEYKRPPDY